MKFNILARISFRALTCIVLFSACSQHAKDIELTDLNQHRAYQDSKLDNNDAYQPDLLIEYQDILASNRDSPHANYLLARVQEDKQLGLLLKAIKLDSLFAPAYNRLAFYYLSNKEQPVKALKYSYKAIEIDSTNALYYGNIALAYVYLSDATDDLSKKYKHVQRAYEVYNQANSKSSNKIYSEEVLELENFLLELKETIKETAHIGTWIYSDGLFSYTKYIYQNGIWESNGMFGYSAGTWERNARNITFYENGFIYSKATINEDGTILSEMTDVGTMKLRKR